MSHAGGNVPLKMFLEESLDITISQDQANQLALILYTLLTKGGPKKRVRLAEAKDDVLKNIEKNLKLIEELRALIPGDKFTIFVNALKQKGAAKRFAKPILEFLDSSYGEYDLAFSDAPTPGTESRNIIFELVTRALTNARIKLDPRQVGEIVNMVVTRMKNTVRRKGAKEGSGVEDMGEDEILETVTEAMNPSDPKFRAMLEEIIDKGPQTTKSKDLVQGFVKELGVESSAPGFTQKIRALFTRTKVTDTVVAQVTTEEEEKPAPRAKTPDPMVDELQGELQSKIRGRKEARRPISLEQQYGKPVPPPPPRARVTPPPPPTRPVAALTTPPPSMGGAGASAAKKQPPPLTKELFDQRAARQEAEAAKSKPVTPSGGVPYGGVSLRKTERTVSDLKKEPTDLEKTRAAILEKGSSGNSGNPPPKKPGGNRPPSGSF